MNDVRDNAADQRRFQETDDGSEVLCVPLCRLHTRWTGLFNTSAPDGARAVTGTGIQTSARLAWAISRSTETSREPRAEALSGEFFVLPSVCVDAGGDRGWRAAVDVSDSCERAVD